MTLTSRVYLASSNEGKLREFRAIAASSLGKPGESLPAIQFDLLPNFREFPAFEESAETFAENSAGKALHYSAFADEMVLADDSGLVVPALNGAPGVYSARYAGPDATDTDRVEKLLQAMRDFSGDQRRAHFVCVISLALRGRVVAVLSDSVHGSLTKEPQGKDGFGYDPIFFSPELGRTFAEATRDGKNQLSHRGKAFQKALAVVEGSKIL